MTYSSPKKLASVRKCLLYIILINTEALEKIYTLMFLLALHSLFICSVNSYSRALGITDGSEGNLQIALHVPWQISMHVIYIIYHTFGKCFSRNSLNTNTTTASSTRTSPYRNSLACIMQPKQVRFAGIDWIHDHFLFREHSVIGAENEFSLSACHEIVPSDCQTDSKTTLSTSSVTLYTFHIFHINHAAAVWPCKGSIIVSTSTFGRLALVPPKSVDFAFGFLV